MRLLRFGLAVLPLVLGGCGDATQASPSNPASARTTIRARTATQFAVADLAKPNMEDDTGLDPYLAPLLYLQATGSNTPGVPGAVFDEAGSLGVDASRPTVYFADDVVQVDAEDRRQLSFVWFRADAERPTAQGLRVTFGADGHSELIEVLDDASGCEVLYISEALAASMPEGDAAVDEGALIVAGSFGVGPVPTGPYVYLTEGSNDVTAVHCRCQPTQAGETRRLIEYELLPMSALDGLWTSPDFGDAAATLKRLREAEPANGDVDPQ